MSNEKILQSFSSLPPDKLACLLGETAPNHSEPSAISYIEQLKAGYNSIGYKVGLRSGIDTSQLFLKIPKTGDLGIVDPLQLIDTHAETSKPIPDLPITHTIIGLLGDDFIRLQPENPVTGISAILIIQELLDLGRYTPLIDLMASFGAQTIQTADNIGSHSWATESWLDTTYQGITNRMAEIRRIPVVQTDKAVVYKHGLQHVVESRERLDGIARIVGDHDPILTISKIARLRMQMTNLIGRYLPTSKERIAVVHGDHWGANIFVDQQGNTRPIDPAPIKYSDGAYDVVFALSDLVLAQLNKNEGKHFQGPLTDLAERQIREYEKITGDHDVRSYMALFFGYKAFVAAAFDAKDPQHKAKLLDCALGATREGNTKGFKFSFNNLDSYSYTGSNSS